MVSKENKNEWKNRDYENAKLLCKLMNKVRNRIALADYEECFIIKHGLYHNFMALAESELTSVNALNSMLYKTVEAPNNPILYLRDVLYNRIHEEKNKDKEGKK